MNQTYIATFHTHLAALRTCRSLTAQGIAAQMTPVPRALSSSCGTCVRYTAPHPFSQFMDGDTEAIYLAEGERYVLLHSLCS